MKWCPNDQTVLANEQVIDGRCERCGHEVEVRQLTQWFFRITDYADRLLDDLDDIDWPAHVKRCSATGSGARRARRSPSATRSWASTTRSSRRARTRSSARRSSSWRPSTPTSSGWSRAQRRSGPSTTTSTTRSTSPARSAATPRSEKTGVFLGRNVVNPVNGEHMPMYVADYVLMEYGTGAIMAVPAHDQRDHDFATQFDLPIRQVVGRRRGRPGARRTPATGRW